MIYNDFYIIVDGTKTHIQEGSGDNLLDEDVENGFVDYCFVGPEEDETMVLLTVPYQSFKSEQELIEHLYELGFLATKEYDKIIQTE